MSHNILTLDEALFSLKFLVSFSPLPAMDVSDRKPLICSAMTCCDTLVSYLIILPFSLCLPWMTCTGILNLQCMFLWEPFACHGCVFQVTRAVRKSKLLYDSFIPLLLFQTTSASASDTTYIGHFGIDHHP